MGINGRFVIVVPRAYVEVSVTDARDPAGVLGEVEEATKRVIQSAAAFDDEQVREPSLCPGWTRAHVLAH